MVFFFVFLSLVLIGLVTMGLILLAALGRGPGCPVCRGSSLPIRLCWLARRLIRLERRWCLDCGWEGLLRRGQPRPVAPSPVDAEQPWPV